MRKATVVALALASAWLIASDCAGEDAVRPPRASAKLPFTLTWTQGTCHSCKTAHSIVDVQYLSPSEAWAIGFNPPGNTGEGDYAVLHTRDAGKSWTEIPEPWQHNSRPNISFANAKEGWLRDMDIGAGETRLLETRDS